MLFNSYPFIFFFLPITLVVYYQFSGRGYLRAALAWLVLASLFFYGWWNPVYVFLLVGSIAFNYWTAGLMEKVTRPGLVGRKGILIFGIVWNLGLLGFFKYANFFIDSLNFVMGTHLGLAPILLPLAISFFTFQQITYLVDSYTGHESSHDFIHYCLYVCFFPQLIAGPIVRSAEMLPQYVNEPQKGFSHENFSVGITLFLSGLFKKVVIADGVATFARPLFEAAQAGQAIPFFDAWLGALAYTLQLYFDFSGYSEMAIGMARMFGFRLPINFNSPYKAASIIDFWRRWHITLSRFMLDYLYIALGGNRKGEFRRYANLLFTMLLGGLWHGANWTFVVWGGLHGLMLGINHAWHWVKRNWDCNWDSPVYVWACRLLTFTCVMLAWVLFRAESFPAAMEIYRGMLGLNGSVLDPTWARKVGWFVDAAQSWGWTVGPEIVDQSKSLWQCGLLLVVVWFLPNTLEWTLKYQPALGIPWNMDPLKRFGWNPSTGWAVVVLAGAVYTVFKMTHVSEFLYFQF